MQIRNLDGRESGFSEESENTSLSVGEESVESLLDVSQNVDEGMNDDESIDDEESMLVDDTVENDDCELSVDEHNSLSVHDYWQKPNIEGIPLDLIEKLSNVQKRNVINYVLSTMKL